MIFVAYKMEFLGFMDDSTTHVFGELTDQSLRALGTTHAGDFPGPELSMFGLMQPRK